MLAFLSFVVAVVLCVLNIFAETTIRVEWILGFIALGLLFQVTPYDRPWPARRAE